MHTGGGLDRSFGTEYSISGACMRAYMRASMIETHRDSPESWRHGKRPRNRDRDDQQRSHPKFTSLAYIETSRT